MNEEFDKRIRELCAYAVNRGVARFTDFLSPSALKRAKTLAAAAKCDFCEWGGAEWAERKIMGFGSAVGDFPLVILRIAPKNPRFFAPLTHRDYLGAILGAGIKRDKVGDIFVSGDTAYAVVADTVANAVEKIDAVGGNSVKTERAETVPEETRPKSETRRIVASSMRADVIVSRVFSLSRLDAGAYIKNSRVALNGTLLAKDEKRLSVGDVVSVRGKGKFRLLAVEGNTKKDKILLLVEIFS